MREGNPRLNRNEQMHLHHGSLVQLPAAGPPLHQISRTILHSGLINEVLRGKFLSPHEEDIVVTRRNSLQLYTEKLDPKGPVQPLFFSICNMQVLRAADCRTRASGPEVSVVPYSFISCLILIMETTKSVHTSFHLVLGIRVLLYIWCIHAV